MEKNLEKDKKVKRKFVFVGNDNTTNIKNNSNDVQTQQNASYFPGTNFQIVQPQTHTPKKQPSTKNPNLTTKGKPQSSHQQPIQNPIQQPHSLQQPIQQPSKRNSIQHPQSLQSAQSLQPAQSLQQSPQSLQQPHQSLQQPPQSLQPYGHSQQFFQHSPYIQQHYGQAYVQQPYMQQPYMQQQYLQPHLQQPNIQKIESQQSLQQPQSLHYGQQSNQLLNPYMQHQYVQNQYEQQFNIPQLQTTLQQNIDQTHSNTKNTPFEEGNNNLQNMNQMNLETSNLHNSNYPTNLNKIPNTNLQIQPNTNSSTQPNTFSNVQVTNHINLDHSDNESDFYEESTHMHSHENNCNVGVDDPSNEFNAVFNGNDQYDYNKDKSDVLTDGNVDPDKSTYLEPLLSMSKDEFTDSFNAFYDKWVTSLMMQEDPIKQFLISMKGILSYKSQFPEQTEIGYATIIAKLQVYILYLMQNSENMKFADDELKMYNKKCDQMIHLFPQYFQAYKLICRNRDILFSTNDELENNAEKKTWKLTPSMVDFITGNPFSTKYNDKQKLHIRLLRQLSIRGYRKYGDYCYEEIKTNSGKPTHAWEQSCKIEQFIVDFCNRLTNPENWDILTKQSRTGIDDMVEKLVSLDDPEFPNIQKDRHKFSFKNGIFVTNLKVKNEQGVTRTVSRFYPYNSEDILQVSNKLASAKYHNIDFHDYAEDEIIDWYDIPTPSCQKVLDHQYKYLPEQEYIAVCKWFYVHIGRLLYDIGELDNWQVMMYILGEPGTGKSTIFQHFVQKIYDDLEIGILDNNMESQFGLENLLESTKYILLGQELDEKFKLERTSFLRMISGEPVMAARKNKMAVKTTFECHMACCGNKIIGYQDNKGELKRRIIPFIYDHKVLPSQTDPNLHKKLEKELPAILQKCVWAYIEYSEKYGNQSIWNVLPKYFKQASQRVAERNNPRRAFLESNEIVYGEGFYVTETEFRTRFTEFCKQRNFGRIKFEFESWKSEFQDISHEKDMKIDVEIRADKIYPRNGGMMVSRENFIIGLDVKTDDFVVRHDDNE